MQVRVKRAKRAHPLLIPTRWHADKMLPRANVDSSRIQIDALQLRPQSLGGRFFPFGLFVNLSFHDRYSFLVGGPRTDQKVSLLNGIASPRPGGGASPMHKPKTSEPCYPSGTKAPLLHRL